MCEYSFYHIRTIENNRNEDEWMSTNAEMYGIRNDDIKKYHITVINWVKNIVSSEKRVDVETEKIIIIHVTYRLNSESVIHFGFSTPKHQSQPPKFWGENINVFSIADKEKLKFLFADFIKSQEIELPNSCLISENLASWRNEEHKYSLPMKFSLQSVHFLSKRFSPKNNNITTNFACWRNL